MEILLVEDGLLDARMTIKSLRQAPFRSRVSLVRDGNEALDYLHQRGLFAKAPRPDVVLLDLVLPNRSGLEILEEIRRTEQLARLPVVVMTASDSAEDRARCESFRADYYITKPVNRDKFLEVLMVLEVHWHQDIILPFEKRDGGAYPGTPEPPKLP